VQRSTFGEFYDSFSSQLVQLIQLYNSAVVDSGKGLVLFVTSWFKDTRRSNGKRKRQGGERRKVTARVAKRTPVIDVFVFPGVEKGQ